MPVNGQAEGGIYRSQDAGNWRAGVYWVKSMQQRTDSRQRNEFNFS